MTACRWKQHQIAEAVAAAYVDVFKRYFDVGLFPEHAGTQSWRHCFACSWLYWLFGSTCTWNKAWDRCRLLNLAWFWHADQEALHAGMRPMCHVESHQEVWDGWLKISHHHVQSLECPRNPPRESQPSLATSRAPSPEQRGPAKNTQSGLLDPAAGCSNPGGDEFHRITHCGHSRHPQH